VLLLLPLLLLLWAAAVGVRDAAERVVAGVSWAAEVAAAAFSGSFSGMFMMVGAFTKLGCPFGRIWLRRSCFTSPSSNSARQGVHGDTAYLGPARPKRAVIAPHTHKVEALVNHLNNQAFVVLPVIRMLRFARLIHRCTRPSQAL
jgi:hypothetical protein